MKEKTSDRQLITKLIFRLLPVQILLCLIGAVNGIISSLFASNFVGVDAMSAVGLYAPVAMFIGAVSTMITGGAAILCGKHMGRNQPEKTQQIFSVSILIASTFAAVFTLLLVILGAFGLTGFFTTDPNVKILFNKYLLGQAAGMLPTMLGNLFATFLSLENRTRLTTAASIVFIGANVVLNYVFVQLLRMEALGLALAASLGMWVFMLIEASHFFTKKSFFRFSLKGLSLRGSGEMIKIGAPGAVGYGYQSLRGIIVNSLILQFVGSVGVSAFAAANTLLGLAWTIPGGMLAVSRMMISISVGEEDRRTLKDVMRNMFYRFLPLMGVICAAIILCAEPLTRLYYRDPSAPVYMMTVWGFRILPLCMPLSIILMHFSCYAQSSGRTALVHVYSVFDGVISVAGFSALLVPLIGIRGVYWANVLNGVVTTILIIGYSCLKNRHFPKNLDQLMVIPADFGVPEEESLEFSLRSMDEVVSVSERVMDFCAEKGIDGRRSYLAGLFIEEMAGNIVAHGFEKDSRKHSVDVRVAHKDGALILRLKDDCVPFDPASRSKIMDPEDITRNIGIRLIYSAAKDISYQNMLGLNVLTVKI